MTTYLRAEFADFGSMDGYLPEYGQASWGGNPGNLNRTGHGYISLTDDLFYTGLSTNNPCIAVQVKTDDIGTWFAFVFNRADQNNYWQLNVSLEESLLILTEVKDGSGRFQKTYASPVTFVTGQDYTIVLDAEDDAIECSIDGNEAFTEVVPGRTHTSATVHGITGNDANVKAIRLIIQG